MAHYDGDGKFHGRSFVYWEEYETVRSHSGYIYHIQTLMQAVYVEIIEIEWHGGSGMRICGSLTVRRRYSEIETIEEHFFDPMEPLDDQGTENLSFGRLVLHYMKMLEDWVESDTFPHDRIKEHPDYDADYNPPELQIPF